MILELAPASAPLPIGSLVGKQLPHAAPRVATIALVTWDKMYMEMKDRLSGDRTLIDGDIEAFGIPFLPDTFTRLSEKFHKGGFLVITGIEQRRKMTSWNYEGMPG